MLLQSLDLRTKMGLRRHVAMDKDRLARVYGLMGKIQLARQLAQESVEISKRLGMTRHYLYMEKFLEELSEN